MTPTTSLEMDLPAMLGPAGMDPEIFGLAIIEPRGLKGGKCHMAIKITAGMESS